MTCDHAAGDAAAGVAGGLRGVVVGIGVDDHGVVYDARRSRRDADAGQRELHVRHPAGIGLQGRHVAGMVRSRLRAVWLAIGVEVAAGARAVGAGAVALLVDVHAVLGARLQAADAGMHHHLIREGSRVKVGLVIESGDAREVHHAALLLGYGAGAINPYLAFETLDDMIGQGLLPGLDQATRNKIRDRQQAMTWPATGELSATWLAQLRTGAA